MQITFNNSTFNGNTQMGDLNIMNLSGSKLKENDWIRIEESIENALKDKALTDEQVSVLQETNEIVRKKDESALKKYLRTKGADLFTGTFSGILAGEIVELLSKLV